MPDPNDLILEFEKSVRRVASRIRPTALAPAIGRLFRMLQGNSELMSLYPPHHVASLWEASCAYYSFDKEVELTDPVLNQSIQVLKDFDDPVLAHQLQPDSDLLEFMFSMHRQQLELQFSPGVLHAGRIAFFSSILTEQNAGQSEDLLEHFGLSFKEATEALFLLYAFLAPANRVQGLQVGKLEDLFSLMGFSRSGWQKFISSCSRSVADFGTAYRQARKTAPTPRVWHQRLPQLVDYPMVRLDSRLAALHPNLLFRWFSERFILRITKECNVRTANEFADAWEFYIGKILAMWFPSGKIVRPDRLVTNVRVGDFLVVAGDAILIVECKLVALRTDCVTAAAVFSSPAVNAVKEGIGQVLLTTKTLMSSPSTLNVPDIGTKKVARIVVTFGEIPSANSEAMWARCLGTPTQEFPWTPSELRSEQALKPQIMSAMDFESFCVACIQENKTPAELILEKESKNYGLVGDWDQYLHSRLIAPGSDPKWSFWHQASDRIMADLDERKARIPAGFDFWKP